MEINEEKLQTLLGKMVTEMGAAAVAPLVLLGDRLGLYKSLAKNGGEKFFRPSYKANLISSWIPALDGVEVKLKAGAKVADIGCGHGASTKVLAEAYPNSEFVGFDFHEPSIDHARQHAEEAGLRNVSFQVATAKHFPGENYDLITFFDCLHDMGDPVGAASHCVKALAPDGTCMIVEPFAHDTLQENLNPVGRAFYSFSTMVCTPSCISQEVGLGLGAQAGEKRLREVVTEGGFTRFRKAADTPLTSYSKPAREPTIFRLLAQGGCVD